MALVTNEKCAKCAGDLHEEFDRKRGRKDNDIEDDLKANKAGREIAKDCAGKPGCCEAKCLATAHSSA